MMKYFRSFLIVFLLAGFFVAPARAANAVSVGYIPLITRVEDTAKFNQQAFQAYRLVLPALMRAQQQGKIARFSVSLNAAIVTVTYTGSFEAKFEQWAVYPSMQRALDMIEWSQPPVGIASIEGGGRKYAPKFLFEVSSSCFIFEGVPSGYSLKFSLFDAQGTLFSNGYARPYPGGWGFACLVGPHIAFDPGLRMKIQVYDINKNKVGDPWVVRAPTIELSSADRSQGTAAGIAIPDKPFTIDAVDFFNRKVEFAAGTTSASGEWQASFSSDAFHGEVILFFGQQVSDQISFSSALRLPHVSCFYEGFCSVFTFPRKDVELTVLHDGQVYAFKGKADERGWFGATVQTQAGENIQFKPGDIVKENVMQHSFEIPLLTVNMDYRRGVVFGNAPARKRFQLSILQRVIPYFWIGFGESYVANKNGAYSVDVAGTLRPTKDQYFIGWITYLDITSGDDFDYLTLISPN